MCEGGAWSFGGRYTCYLWWRRDSARRYPLRSTGPDLS